METVLKQLFDFQRFAHDPALQNVIDQAESRYAPWELSDEELETLSAAGDLYSQASDPGKKDGPR